MASAAVKATWSNKLYSPVNEVSLVECYFLCPKRVQHVQTPVKGVVIYSGTQINGTHPRGQTCEGATSREHLRQVTKFGMSQSAGCFFISRTDVGIRSLSFIHFLWTSNALEPLTWSLITTTTVLEFDRWFDDSNNEDDTHKNVRNHSAEYSPVGPSSGIQPLSHRHKGLFHTRMSSNISIETYSASILVSWVCNSFVLNTDYQNH